MEIWNAITSTAKLPARVILALWFALSAALFGPDQVIQKLGLSDLLEAYRGFAGAAWLVLLPLVLTQTLGWIRLRREAQRDRQALVSRALKAIANLDGKEQAVLREFVLLDQNTVQLPLDHPVVAGLIDNGVLVNVGEYIEHSLAGLTGSFAISDRVRPHLTNELLGWPTEGDSESKKRWLHTHRPEFAGTLAEIRDLRFGRI